jgi:hypothetical protein
MSIYILGGLISITPLALILLLIYRERNRKLPKDNT